MHLRSDGVRPARHLAARRIFHDLAARPCRGTKPAALEFWDLPRPNVSPDGRWVIFTSNWEKTLGVDWRAGTYRQDVCLLRLKSPQATSTVA